MSPAAAEYIRNRRRNPRVIDLDAFDALSPADQAAVRTFQTDQREGRIPADREPEVTTPPTTTTGPTTTTHSGPQGGPTVIDTRGNEGVNSIGTGGSVNLRNFGNSRSTSSPNLSNIGNPNIAINFGVGGGGQGYSASPEQLAFWEASSLARSPNPSDRARANSIFGSLWQGDGQNPFIRSATQEGGEGGGGLPDIGWDDVIGLGTSLGDRLFSGGGSGDYRDWGSNSASQETTAWGPAVQAAQDHIGGVGVLGNIRQFNPEQTRAQGTPEFNAFLNQHLQAAQQGKLSPGLAQLADVAGDRADLQASMGGRYGSGFHAGHVARALAPYHVQQQQWGAQAGNRLAQFEQGRLDDATDRHNFAQNEPINAWNRQAQGISNFAGMGQQTGGTSYWDQAHHGAVKPFNDLYGNLIGGGGRR